MTSVSTTKLVISFDSLTFVVRLHVRTVGFGAVMCALYLPALSELSGVGRSGPVRDSAPAWCYCWPFFFVCRPPKMLLAKYPTLPCLSVMQPITASQPGSPSMADVLTDHRHRTCNRCPLSRIYLRSAHTIACTYLERLTRR
jgi:hypothetical protein